MAYRISGKAGGSESEQKTAEAEQPELQARSLGISFLPGVLLLFPHH